MSAPPYELEEEEVAMATSNLNVRTDTTIKKQAETIFTELGMNMTTAVNLFLRATVRAKMACPLI